MAFRWRADDGLLIEVFIWIFSPQKSCPSFSLTKLSGSAHENTGEGERRKKRFYVSLKSSLSSQTGTRLCMNLCSSMTVI